MNCTYSCVGLPWILHMTGEEAGQQLKWEWSCCFLQRKWEIWMEKRKGSKEEHELYLETQMLRSP
jgi:hypothetical protein